jgi:phenylpyruvate tautomerase PptA (4-oxalocrotonate tautomerase family)
MPYINTKTNVTITPGKETSLKEKLGKAISILPGKSESYLMLSFEEDCQMYFKGDNEAPMAFVDVKLFGTQDAQHLVRLTGEITKAIQDVLAIKPDHVYISYFETSNWGWNGSNLGD